MTTEIVHLQLQCLITHLMVTLQDSFSKKCKVITIKADDPNNTIAGYVTAVTAQNTNYPPGNHHESKL